MRCISIACMTFMLYGCAGFYQGAGSTIGYVDAAVDGLTNASIPVINRVCEDTVRECAVNQDSLCPGWEKCKEVRAEVVSKIVLIKRAVALANAALASKDAESADSYIAVAVDVLGELRKLLKEIGVI